MGSPKGGDCPILQLARENLSRLAGDDSLEGIWIRAGSEAVLMSTPVDPPTQALKVRTTPERTWSMPEWDIEAIQDRVHFLVDCSHLAIAIADTDWLERLDETWRTAPGMDSRWSFQRGQIGLALRRNGRDCYIWTEEDLELFIEQDEFLNRDNPKDRAWLSLWAMDIKASQLDVDKYREAIEIGSSKRAEASFEEARSILAFPGEILRVELRALQALTRHINNFKAP